MTKHGYFEWVRLPFQGVKSSSLSYLDLQVHKQVAQFRLILNSPPENCRPIEAHLVIRLKMNVTSAENIHVFSVTIQVEKMS